MLPVALDKPGVLQSVDDPVHRGTRAPRSLLDFPAVNVSPLSVRIKQNF
jgi:hypothetical protein